MLLLDDFPLACSFFFFFLKNLMLAKWSVGEVIEDFCGLRGVCGGWVGGGVQVVGLPGGLPGVGGVYVSFWVDMDTEWKWEMGMRR